MYHKIITFASVLTITSASFANTPDLGDKYKFTTSERIENKITVEDLTGAAVVDKYGEQIASIQDFEVDPNSGEISTAYLAVGGVMGIGSQYLALPYSELSYDKVESRFTVAVSQSEMKAYMAKQKRLMDAREHSHAHLDHDDMHDESRFATIWQNVKTSLGVGEEELAEVEAEVRGDKLYLEGEVRDSEVKKKIGIAFESSTELQVVNNIKVQK